MEGVLGNDGPHIFLAYFNIPGDTSAAFIHFISETIFMIPLSTKNEISYQNKNYLFKDSFSLTKIKITEKSTGQGRFTL